MAVLVTGQPSAGYSQIPGLIPLTPFNTECSSPLCLCLFELCVCTMMT